jgi:tryptophanyl-tRNA synthetase
MSKSETENPNNVIFLLDPPNVIMGKIKKAVTDSGGDIIYNPAEKPGVSNLLAIYAAVADKTIDDAGREFEGVTGYGAFKEKVGEAVVAALSPLQKRFDEIVSDKAYLDGIMSENAERAGKLARRTLSKVKKKVGFVSL